MIDKLRNLRYNSIKGDDSVEKIEVHNLRVDADAMTVQQLRAELQAGYQDMSEGKVQDAKSAFDRFRESRQ